MQGPDYTRAGRLIKMTGCVRTYRDGDGYNEVFRWWHPVSWITWLVCLLICGVIGEKVNEVVRFRLSPYWRERKDEIEWL